MTELDRRTVLASFAAFGVVTAAARLATSPVGVKVIVDHEIERLREWVGQIFRGLRAEGIAVVKPPERNGVLVFWLKDDNDLTSVQMIELDENIEEIS
ncbi:MAG: hypothetical protein QOJ15_2384 [Bradyrhizobium sp.]|nr:hypothetical protein [Bradyrhizobium sp.]